MTNQILLTDCLSYMQDKQENFIDLTFTSPPYYNARDYSNYQSYQDYLSFLQNVFSEVFRLTNNGRFCIVNTSPVLTERARRSAESVRHPIPFDLHHIMQQIGWQYLDDIIWIKPEPSVKNRNAGFGQHRKPLAYKPNTVTEYLFVYRKPDGKLLDYHMRKYDKEIIQQSLVDNYPSTNVWFIPPARDKIHKAVFPYKLCENVVKLYSYVGDTIYDPFCGIGTLGRAAIDLKRKFIGTEFTEKYFLISKEIMNNYDIQCIE